MPLQVQNEIRHGDALIRCEACGVILAAPEPVPEGGEEPPAEEPAAEEAAAEAGADEAEADEAPEGEDAAPAAVTADEADGDPEEE